MVSNEGILYVSNRNGVVASGDAEPGNPRSGIVKLGQYVFEKLKLQLGLKMPLPIMIGMNVTPDGRIIAVTIDGTVVAIEPDLSSAVYHNLSDEQIWNSIAVDENGGVYVPGTKKLHKLVWKDGRFSDDSGDGAWFEPYEIGSLDETLRAERDSGTTPALLANNQVKTNEKMWLDVQLKMKDPVVTTKDRQLHTVGLKDAKWTMQTLDWDTGETRAAYTLGESERYNPIMLALQVLPNGDPLFATFGGVMHLRIGETAE